VRNNLYTGDGIVVYRFNAEPVERFDTTTRAAWFTDLAEDAIDYGEMAGGSGSVHVYALNGDYVNLEDPVVHERIRDLIEDCADLVEVTQQMPLIRRRLMHCFDGVKVRHYAAEATHFAPFFESCIKGLGELESVNIKV
jgi:hypothetical protein